MAGPFNPALQEDVDLAIDPKNKAGEPVAAPFNWSVSDQSAGSLVVADDQKSAKFVTTDVTDFDVVVSVTQPSTGKTETVHIARSTAPPPPPPPPPDTAVDTFNLTGSVVPKAPPAPAQ